MNSSLVVDGLLVVYILFPHDQQEPNCNAQGINLGVTGSYPVNCRFGMAFNNENDCLTYVGDVSDRGVITLTRMEDMVRLAWE